MFRPVSVELWLSDKNQVKSCFKPHSRCLTKSLEIRRFFGRKSELRDVLAIMFRCVCVLPSPKFLHIPLLLGEVPIANVGGHWNKKQGEQAHTRHKQHLHHRLNPGAG